MERVETVKIARKNAPGGFVVINKADQKPTDKVYTEPKAKKEKG